MEMKLNTLSNFKTPGPTLGSAPRMQGSMPDLDLSGGMVPAQSFVGRAYNSYQQGLEQSEARALRREQADYIRKLREQQLYEMGVSNAAGIPELQAQELATRLQAQEAQNKMLTQELDKNQMFTAFDRFTSDGETRHLNVLLKNPRLQELFGGVAAIDKINPNDVEDLRMLSKEVGRDVGVAFDQGAINTEALRNRILKVTSQDGSRKLVDIQSLYGMTGYLNHLDTKKQEAIVAALDIKAKQAQTQDKLAGAELKLANARKADRWMPGMGAGQGETAAVRNAQAIGEARTRIEQGKGTPADYALLERHDEETMGNTPGKQRRIDQEEQNLFSSFGGEQGFYSQKFEPNTQEFNQAMRSVRKIEALAGVELSNKQVETIGNIRKTIAAGQRAAGLQPGDVGLVDNVLKKLGAYVSDDAMGAEARSAWAGIRNQLLHAFAGSAMNEGELERWGEQFGNLYQQGGHVLTTLANALDQLGGELDSLRVALPEASFHVRLGSDVEKLNTVINNISAAAATLSNKANPQGKMQPMTPSYPGTTGYMSARPETQPPVKSEADKFRELLQQRQQRQGAN